MTVVFGRSVGAERELWAHNPLPEVGLPGRRRWGTDIWLLGCGIMGVITVSGVVGGWECVGSRCGGWRHRSRRREGGLCAAHIVHTARSTDIPPRKCYSYGLVLTCLVWAREVGWLWSVAVSEVTCRGQRQRHSRRRWYERVSVALNTHNCHTATLQHGATHAPTTRVFTRVRWVACRCRPPCVGARDNNSRAKSCVVVVVLLRCRGVACKRCSVLYRVFVRWWRWWRCGGAGTVRLHACWL